VRTVSSYCRICEALCGTLVDVDDNDVVVRNKGDPDHPGSRGYLCPKGAAMAKTQTAEERITAPRRRRGDEWTTVSWDDALNEIAERLQRILDLHGPHSVAMYVGNPSAFSASHGTWAQGLMDAIGSRNYYTPGPQDQSARQVANWFLYGSTTVFPLPDIVHTDFLLALGANPFVSHGST
jgi:anaerobic selenocysteine-containing dehydrogenase